MTVIVTDQGFQPDDWTDGFTALGDVANDVVALDVPADADPAGALDIPEALDIPLAPGQVRLLSLQTQPFVAQTFHEAERVTTRLALEWREGLQFVGLGDADRLDLAEIQDRARRRGVRAR